MKRILTRFLIANIAWIAVSCGSHEPKKTVSSSGKPVVKDSGRVVVFPADSITLAFFKTEVVTKSDLNAELSVPARVVATIVHSRENPEQNLVLFDNPDRTATHTETAARA